MFHRKSSEGKFVSFNPKNWKCKIFIPGSRSGSGSQGEKNQENPNFGKKKRSLTFAYIISQLKYYVFTVCFKFRDKKILV